MLLDVEPGPPKALRAARRSGLWCAWVVTLIGLFWTEPASAYSWMIRHSYTGCGVCHADPSGGELLTMYGRMQGNLLLRMQYGAKAESSEESDAFSDDAFSDDAFGDFDDFADFDESSDADSGEGDEEQSDADEASPGGDDGEDKGKNAGGGAAAEEPQVGFLWGLLPTPAGVLLGGSFRNLAIYQLGDAADPFKYVPIMMGDLYMHARADSVRLGASVGIAKVKPGSPHARAAQVTHSQGDQINMLSRTHWLGFDMGASDQYLLRFGRINLPFGVRVPEHTLWAREATRTDRESDQQHGAALAYTGDSFRMEAMGIAGNYQISPDRYRERGYSLFLEYFATSTLGVGASSLVTFVEEDRILLRKDVLRQAHGVLGRAALTEWMAVLAEANVLMTSGASTGYVGFAQFDIEAIQGLHFMVTGEFVNQGQTDGTLASPGAGEPRLGAWASIDWFFYDQFEFRIDAVMRQDADLQFLGQLHFYL